MKLKKITINRADLTRKNDNADTFPYGDISCKAGNGDTQANKALSAILVDLYDLHKKED